MLTKLLSLVLLVAQVQSYSVHLHSSPLYDLGQESFDVLVTVTGACSVDIDLSDLWESSLMFEGNDFIDFGSRCTCNKAAANYRCVCFAPFVSGNFRITIPKAADHGASNTAHVELSIPMKIDFHDDQLNENCPLFTGNPCVYNIRVATDSDATDSDNDGFLFGPGTFSVGAFTELSTSYINSNLILSFLVTADPPLSFTVQAAPNSLISSSTGRGNSPHTKKFEFAIKGSQPTARPTAQPTPVPAFKVPLAAESADLCTGKPVDGKCTAKNPQNGNMYRERFVGTQGGFPNDSAACACDPECVNRDDCCQSFFKNADCCSDDFCKTENNPLKVFRGDFLSCHDNTNKCNSAFIIKSGVNPEYNCQCGSGCITFNNCCGGREDRNEACNPTP